MKLKNCAHKKKESVFISFLNEIEKQSTKITPNFAMLDTIVFNPDGSIKYVVVFEQNKLKFMKLKLSLKTFIF